ncbi:preprotein translocase subunit SecG [Inhella gelatinilytica]|uniref:Protein-export membrane protein SecG n=1 Tax=Inhella gelatinilytica TaxID=2795030 RepID=A0A931IVZ8_9BURK|nr:preprotein translocase subunit SecG [Inhella gelatinilytica]MBH9553822.1 preprotein translocase subunit SecG [Inhella gelatinilytica]
MQFLLNLVLAVQLISAVAMIILVLMQHGKGADMGASFGAGASGTLFGATGSANVLSKATALCATLFFACTLVLAYTGTQRRASSEDKGSILDAAPAVVASEPQTGAAAIPVAPTAASTPASAASQ